MEIPRRASPTKKNSMPSQNRSLKKKLGEKLARNHLPARQNLSNSIVSDDTKNSRLNPVASEYGVKQKRGS